MWKQNLEKLLNKTHDVHVIGRDVSTDPHICSIVWECVRNTPNRNFNYLSGMIEHRLRGYVEVEREIKGNPCSKCEHFNDNTYGQMGGCECLELQHSSTGCASLKKRIDLLLFHSNPNFRPRVNRYFGCNHHSEGNNYGHCEDCIHFTRYPHHNGGTCALKSAQDEGDFYVHTATFPPTVGLHFGCMSWRPKDGTTNPISDSPDVSNSSERG